MKKLTKLISATIISLFLAACSPVNGLNPSGGQQGGGESEGGGSGEQGGGQQGGGSQGGDSGEGDGQQGGGSSGGDSGEGGGQQGGGTEQVTLSSIEITHKPTKTTYQVGESFDKTGLVVTAIYSDQSSKPVVDYTLSGFSSAAAGTVTVTVTYEGKTATFNVVIQKSSQSGSDEITLVESISDLTIGDEVVIASYAKGAVAGTVSTGKSSTYLSSVNASFSSNHKTMTKLPNNAVVFTVGGSSGKYTLSNNNKLLGTTGAKKVDWDKGTTTWDISIASGDATIESTYSSNGRFLYNSTSPRFTTYTSNTTSSMVLPQLYKVGAAEPIYPSDIFVSGSASELSLGETAQLSVTFSPSNVNQKTLSFESSNSSVASISSSGLITAKAEGSTTITVSTVKADGSLITKTFELTVKVIKLESISIASSLEIPLNGSEKLTPTFTPANASNKSVTWTSSNASVATVDSNGNITPKAVGNTTITVTSQDGNKTATCDVTITEAQLDAWTIMIYLCGSDLESDGGYATKDLKEILSVSNQPKDVNIIVETGGASSWSRTYSISSSKVQRWHVENKNLVKDADLTNISMGASSTFQSFLEWGINSYPAQKTGVILWDHGGAMFGACYDEKHNDDSLLASEVNTALSNAFKSTGRTSNLEFIGYDCCLMQIQDLADINSNYFNYMVASEESEAGEGWDYDTWVDDLYAKKSTESILTAIVDGFIADTTAGYGKDSDQTLSFLDLTQFATYKSAFESLADSLYSSSISKANFQSFMKKNVKCYGTTIYDNASELSEAGISTSPSSQQYYGNYGIEYINGDYYDWGYNYFGIFDAMDFLVEAQSNSMFSSMSDKLATAKAALNSVIVYSNKGSAAGDSYGVCLYMPLHEYCSSDEVYELNKETYFTNWHKVVEKFGE